MISKCCTGSIKFLKCENNFLRLCTTFNYSFSTVAPHEDIAAEKEKSDITNNDTTKSISSLLKDDSWNVWWKSKSYGNHPGVCNLNAVSIPSQLNISAKQFLKNKDKKILSTVSEKLNNILYSRRVCKKPQTLVKQTKGKKVALEKTALEYVNLSPKEHQDALDNEKLSEKEKRESIYNWKQLVYDDLNAASYLLCRSPACYSVALRVMSEIKKNVPNFNPQSLLDFGSGTGMCTWAANALWKNSLKQYLCIDSSREMNELAFFLLSGGKFDRMLPGVFIRQFLPVSFQNSYDIVISAYSLSELPTEKERLILLKLLWEKTNRYLILIEAGNFYGYYIMMEARNLLLYGLEGADRKSAKKWSKFRQSANVFSPCSHNFDCPIWKKDACVFSQKYFSPEYHQKFFNKSNSIAIERFSYLVLEKTDDGFQSSSKWPRAIADPHCLRKCTICHLCTTAGEIEHVPITRTKHGKDLVYVSKKTKQGDMLPLFPVDSKIE